MSLWFFTMTYMNLPSSDLFKMFIIWFKKVFLSVNEAVGLQIAVFHFISAYVYK